MVPGMMAEVVLVVGLALSIAVPSSTFREFRASRIPIAIPENLEILVLLR